MITLGITGGIGSGKSYVCRLLHGRGIPIYSCDDEAKRLMVENATIRQQLQALIGDDAYTTDGTLNKPVIAQFLFANPDNAALINGIVHPVVRQDFAQWVSHQTSPIAAQECALLFESGFTDTVDKTVLVYAPETLRLQRAMQRDHATAQQIKARMAQQLDEEAKRQRADFCILNDGTADLEEQIEQLLTQIAK